jgi:hypothetical protein
MVLDQFSDIFGPYDWPRTIRVTVPQLGGGVTIYVKNSLYYKVRTEISINNLEILWVEIRNSNNDNFLVGVIYRPPNSNLHIWELFCESVDKALDSDLPLFLVGDYNCDMLSNSSNYFKKILNRLNLENVVLEATNFTTGTGTCIDLCITI